MCHDIDFADCEPFTIDARDASLIALAEDRDWSLETPGNAACNHAWEPADVVEGPSERLAVRNCRCGATQALSLTDLLEAVLNDGVA